MRSNSASDVKIQHHTYLRGQCELLGQMFRIIINLLSPWKNLENTYSRGDMASYIFVNVIGFHLR